MNLQFPLKETKSDGLFFSGSAPVASVLQNKQKPKQELNDKRAQEEERKQLEMEARQKLEKQLAKEEFHKQLLEWPGLTFCWLPVSDFYP